MIDEKKFRRDIDEENFVLANEDVIEAKVFLAVAIDVAISSYKEMIADDVLLEETSH